MTKTVQQQLQEAYLQMHSGATKALSEDEQIVEDLLALDELSKKTLGSYVKHAAFDVKNNQAYGTMLATQGKNGEKWVNKANKRLNGIVQATDKLTKEQKETIEDILEDLDAEFALEEALELYELSKKTLGSYIKKASNSAGFHAQEYTKKASTHNYGPGQASSPNLSKAKSLSRYKKRIAGIAQASDKLTKEQQEFIGSILESIEEESED